MQSFLTESQLSKQTRALLSWELEKVLGEF